ncbi:MAG: M23 family metallopeptidase [Clostridia bacterium]|nr:M23 family metallopeptidase [Clostridia bacterium]
METDSKIRELVGLKEPSEENTISSRSNGQGGLGIPLDRTVQPFSIINNDILPNYVFLTAVNIPEISKKTYYELDKEPGLDTINKIKNDMEFINSIIHEQKVVLAKLEEDVKERLDYLDAVPNAWPVNGRITDKYGWRKNPFNKKKLEFHEGLDIAASYGTPVKAAGGGKVIFAGWKPAYGNTVVIKHGYGYVSKYAHNSKINVKVGQVVKRGDIIARVGSTGRSTGPHVDFRIQYNGVWIDPLKVLK